MSKLWYLLMKYSCSFSEFSVYKRFVKYIRWPWLLISLIAILIFFLIKYLSSLHSSLFLTFRIFLINKLLKYASTINFSSDSILCLEFSFSEFFVSSLTVLSINDLIISSSSWLGFNITCFWYSVFLLSALLSRSWNWQVNVSGFAPCFLSPNLIQKLNSDKSQIYQICP